MQLKLTSLIKLISILVLINSPVAHGQWKIGGKPVEAPAPSSDTANSDSDQTPDSVESHELSSKVGKGEIYPIFNVSAGYRTDVYEENGDKIKGAPLISWRIGGGYQAENRGHLYGAEYLIEGNEFISGKNDENEVTQRATAYWGTSFTPHHHLDLGIEYIDGYDPRGEENSLRNIRHNTIGQEPDQWEEKSGGGIYSFGADNSRGRIELSGYLTNREYDNNQQQYRDRDEVDLGAAVYLKVAPKTQIFAQAVYTELDYVDQTLSDPTAGRSLDSEEWRYMVGTKWQPTKKLSGILRLGTAEKTFDAGSGRSDYDELSWDSNLLWTPNFKNSFGLSYSRSPRETYVYSAAQIFDDFIEVEQLELSWSHLWGSKLRTSLGYYVGEDNYQPTGRTDDRDGYSVGLSYPLPRWGTIGLNYQHRELSSSLMGHEYDEDYIFIYFNLGAAFGLGDGNSRAPGLRNQRSFRPGYAIY